MSRDAGTPAPIDADPVEDSPAPACQTPEPLPVIHEAALSGDVARLSTLLKDSYSIDERDACGRTPLMWALTPAVPELMFALHPTKRDIARNVAKMESRNVQHLKAAEWLLSRGADATLVDVDGETALHSAARFRGGGEKLVAVLDRLATLDSDMNRQNRFGESPLMVSARTGRVEIARWLVEKGANINLRNNQNQSALEIAQTWQNRAVEKFLQTSQSGR